MAMLKLNNENSNEASITSAKYRRPTKKYEQDCRVEFIRVTILVSPLPRELVAGFIFKLIAEKLLLSCCQEDKLSHRVSFFSFILIL